MVYVARGSHASYFDPGFHQTEAWYDLADGKRNSPRCALEVVTDDDPPWIAWPGVWGDTRARVGGIDQPSPRGPSAHASWTDPDAALATAWQPQRKDAIAPPAVRIARDRGRMRIDFDFTRQHGPPASALQVTVNSQRRVRRAAAHLHLPRDRDRERHARHRIPLDPAKHYDVYASTTSGTRRSRRSRCSPSSARPGAVAKLPLAERAMGGFGRLVARLRGQLGR